MYEIIQTHWTLNIFYQFFYEWHAVSIYENNNNNSISETTTSMWLCLTIYAKLRTTVSLDTSRPSWFGDRLIGPNVLRNEGATYHPHSQHYICYYQRKESRIFTHKIVCFVIIFDLLRLVALSYNQEENLCILRRRDVLSLHFFVLLALFTLLFAYDQLLSKWKKNWTI